MANQKYTKELLEEAVKQSTSVTGVLRYLGLKIAGGTHYHISKKIKKYNISTAHFESYLENLKKGQGCNKKKPEEYLIFDKNLDRRQATKKLVRSLLELGVPYSCVECGLENFYNGKPLVLQLDHISGVWNDNRIENLRFLCPNCHTQTDTYCKRNKKSLGE